MLPHIYLARPIRGSGNHRAQGVVEKAEMFPRGRLAKVAMIGEEVGSVYLDAIVC